MRIRSILQVLVVCAPLSCASEHAEVERLQARVAELEGQLGDHSAPTPRAFFLSNDAAVPPFTHAIAVELGEREFYQSDWIEISEVRGTERIMSEGGTYLVTGRYRLASRDSATLLFSVTTTENTGPTPTEPTSEVRVKRGEGEFTLMKRFDHRGYPHLTFYGSSGSPFGGVYFGQGPWVLKKKGWRYGGPFTNPILPPADQAPFQLL